MKTPKKTTAEICALEEDLFTAILQLKTPDECRRFFYDLCTVAEIEAFRDRWQVVHLIVVGEPYRAIAAKTGVSLATISRVAKFLNGENKGYTLILERLKNQKTNIPIQKDTP